MLGDLTVDLDYGVGPHIYTNAKTGLPQTMKGLRRSRESRKFFTKASELIASRTHRLEFHNENRKVHVQVVPQGSHKHAWRSGGSGRVGGGTSSMTFAVIRALEDSVDPLAFADDLSEAVGDAVGQVRST